MEQLRIVQQIGNGAHVYLPKETVGKKVVITLQEKTIKDIEEETINLLRPYLKHIKGIYLHGSYARNEQTPESDIDILVITNGKIKIKKRINEYEINSTTEEQIQKTIKNNAVLLLHILKEAKPILNQELIEGYKKQRLTKKNTKWYMETTDSSLKLAKYVVEEKQKKDMPSVVYPLILRLRGLYLVKALINNKGFSNKNIIDHLVKKGISSDKAKQLYRMYREHRDSKSISENSLDYKDIGKLYDIVYKYYLEIKSLWAKLR